MEGIILVTGGSRGIGAAISLKLAAIGYKVAINFVNDKAAAEKVVQTIEERGGKAILLQADISKESEVLSMFEVLDAQPEKLVALVNNAAILTSQSKVVDMSAERIERVFKVNVLGTMICSREAIKRMSAKYGGKGGSIVNISSGASKIGSPNAYVDYAATKGAIDTFTIGLATELAQENIRVNAIRPGFIATEIHQIPNRLEKIKDSIPMGRVGNPEEIAEGVLWLISEKSSYTTGAILDITGGK
ncbi:MAG: SDR family oxidoreductase [Chitinophagales bacterium]|nr:SDR family oxidoreductase [Chitinophagales bacterium]